MLVAKMSTTTAIVTPIHISLLGGGLENTTGMVGIVPQLQMVQQIP